MDELRILSAMAWRNLGRHARRSLLTASAMAVAAAFCMASIALTDGVYVEIFRVLVEQSIGHVVVQHPDYAARKHLFDTVEDAGSRMASLDAASEIEVVAPRLMGFGLVGGSKEAAGAQLVGVLPDREHRFNRLGEQVLTGSYLPDAPAGQALLGFKLAEELEVGLGDEVVVVTQAADGSLGNALYTVAGIARTGNTALDRAGVWLHLAELQELLVLPDQVHQLTVNVRDSAAIASAAEQVRARVGEGPHTQPWWEASPQTYEMIEMSSASKFIILGIVFTVAAFGVVNTMTMSVFERTRELGVLRAIGMRPGRLVALVVLESLQLSLIAVVGALILGGFFDWYLVVYGLDFSASLEEGFSFSGVTIDPVMRGQVRAEGIALTLGSLVLVGMLASLWPAWRAARLQPVEAIRTE